MSAACVLPHANPTAVTASCANAPFSYVNGRLDRVVEDANDVWRRRGLCAVCGVGKADALALGRAYWPVPAMTRPRTITL